MLAGVERLDLVGIALLPGELRRPLGASRPLVGASDYRGATIATRVSDLGLRTFGALGATGKAIVPGADTSSFDSARNLGSTDFRAITTTVPRARSPPT